MKEAWLNFGIAFFVQALFFIAHAYYEKRLSEIPSILRRGILSGLILGLFFDLLLGKYLRGWSYTLGFGALFLILNATLVYGLFSANILLMRKVRLMPFLIWTILMGMMLDITNFFFPVWKWSFSYISVEFLFVFFVGNIGTAILVALVWHVFFGKRFILFRRASK